MKLDVEGRFPLIRLNDEMWRDEKPPWDSWCSFKACSQICPFWFYECSYVNLNVLAYIEQQNWKTYPFNRELEVIPDLVMSGALQHIDHLHVDWTRWELMHEQFSFLQDASQNLTHSCCYIHQRWHFSPQGWLDKCHFGWTTRWINEHPQQTW